MQRQNTHMWSRGDRGLQKHLENARERRGVRQYYSKYECFVILINTRCVKTKDSTVDTIAAKSFMLASISAWSAIVAETA